MSYLLWSIGLGNVSALLARTDPAHFVLASALFVFSQWLTAWRWERILSIRVPHRPRLSYLFGLVMVGMFSNFFLPSAIGGDVVRGELLQARIESRRDAYLSIFFDRFLALLATLVIGTLATALAFFRFGWFDREIAVLVALWGLPFLGLGLIVRTSVAEQILGRLRGGRLEAFAGPAQRAVESLRAYGTDRRQLLIVFAASFAVQVVGNILTVWCLARGMEITVPGAFHFIAIPIILLITMLPVSVNGIGLREGAFVYLYGRVGLAPEEAIAISVAWTLMLALISLAGGALLLHPERYRWSRKRPLLAGDQPHDAGDDVADSRDHFAVGDAVASGDASHAEGQNEQAVE